MSLILTWSENFVLTSKATRDAAPAADSVTHLTKAILKIKDTKLYVPIVTLSAENDNKLLERLKTGFERTIKWKKKYGSEMSNQAANNNLNYLIDPTFTNVNRLFVLSFENEKDRTSFSRVLCTKSRNKRL